MTPSRPPLVALPTAAELAAGRPQPIRARMRRGDIDTMHADSLEPLDLVAAIRHDPLVWLHVGRAMSIAERYGEARSACVRTVLARAAGRVPPSGAMIRPPTPI